MDELLLGALGFGLALTLAGFALQIASFRDELARRERESFRRERELVELIERKLNGQPL